MWNTALIVAGAILGDRWEEVGDVVGLFQAVVILVLGAIIALLAWKYVVRPRLAAAGDLPPDDVSD